MPTHCLHEKSDYMKPPYQPINCAFHDSLLAKATQKEQVRIHYFLEEGKETMVQDVIVDVYTQNGEEFLTLSSGETIRLDYLIAVGGEMKPLSC